MGCTAASWKNLASELMHCAATRRPLLKFETAACACTVVVAIDTG